jgi:hypothetical protein
MAQNRVIVVMPDGTEIDAPEGVTRSQIMERYQPQQAPAAADTSPIELRPDIPVEKFISLQDERTGSPLDAIAMPGGNALMVAPFIKVPTAQRELARSGVDVSRGLPEARVAVRLAPNQDFAYNSLKGVLDQKFGKEVPIRYDEKAKDFMFLAPDTNRWTTVKEHGFSKGDLKDMLLGSSTPVAAVAGGITGAAGGPAGAAVGAGSGAFVSELSKLYLGKHLNVHDLSDSEMVERAAKAGGLEAVLTYSGEKVFHAAQVFKRLWSPRPLHTDDSRELLRKLDEALPELDSLRMKFGDEFNPTVPQLAQDPNAQKALGVATGIDSKKRIELERQAAGTQRAVERYGQERLGAEPMAFSDIEGVGQGVVDQATLEMQAMAAARRVENERAMMSVMDNFDLLVPKASRPEAGAAVRQAAKQAFDDLNEQVKSSWSAVDSYFGFNSASGASKYPSVALSDEAAKFFKRMKKEKDEALFGFLRNDASSFVPNIGAGNTVDLERLQRTIVALRARQRDVNDGLVPGVESKDLRDTIRVLEGTRRQFLMKNDPAGLKMLDEAEALRKQRADLFDNTIVGEILVESGKDYKLTNTQVLEKIFQDPDYAGQVARAMSGNPAALLTVQNGLWAVYRNSVMKEGFVDAAAHRQFVNSNADIINQFFTRAEQNKMRTVGGFADVIEDRAANTAAYTKALEKRFQGKIAGTQPGEVVRLLLDTGKKGTTPSDARALRMIVDSAGIPGGSLKEPFERALGTQLSSKFRSMDNYYDPGKVNRYLFGENGAKNREVLRGFMGPEYVNDLETLHRSLMLAKPLKGGVVTPDTKTSQLLNAWLRPIARPLSRLGLIRTAAIDTLDVRASGIMADILSDPEKLRAYVAVADKEVSSREAVRFFTIIGAASLIGSGPDLEETDEGMVLQ